MYTCFDDKFATNFPNRLERPYARYHARTDKEIKKMVINSSADPFRKIRLLIAKIAFGMGVDCKGVYKVIHYGPPADLDDYFQESGRVGRDCKSIVAI